MDEVRKKLKSLLIVGLFSLLLGCTGGGSDPDPVPDPDSEGGVLGTGLILQGTVTDARAFASNSVQIKSSTGEITVKGGPPYLLRADLGNDEYRYGIAFGAERTNINSYTDVILRNWFAGNNGALDDEFERATVTTALPTRVQFQNTANRFFDLVALVLEDYELNGNQLLVGDYDSGKDDDGIDNYLRKNPIFVKDDTVSFVITERDTELQSTLRSGYALYELTTEPDTELPEVPENVRALTGVGSEVVVVWDPSFDNRGVVGYEVFRDGTLIAKQ